MAGPTHTQGGWLNAVITPDDYTCMITDLYVETPSISDHGLLIFTVPYLCAQPVFALRISRGWRHLDHQVFQDGLRNRHLCGNLSTLSDRSTEGHFTLYDATMLPFIDSFISLSNHRVYSRPLQPCRALRRDVRRLDRKFRRTRNRVDRLTLNDHLRKILREYRDEETAYCENLIEREKGNSRRFLAALCDVSSD